MEQVEGIVDEEGTAAGGESLAALVAVVVVAVAAEEVVEEEEALVACAIKLVELVIVNIIETLLFIDAEQFMVPLVC